MMMPFFCGVWWLKLAGHPSKVLKLKGKQYCPGGMKLPPKLWRTLEKREMILPPEYRLI